MKKEPYRGAVRRVDPRKLINLYDLAVWAMARVHSVSGLYLVYRTFVFLKK
ncbi:MAG: hypothetical protein LUF92_06250 [Clostridiales bacterium]|nr:hypothetical protein [Clostridiales bacterium]